MSSLQKFHRRTMSSGSTSGSVWPASVIGMGDSTHGYWLGGAAANKLIVAPKSTETQKLWGSYGTSNTTSTTNGSANTNTLASFGAAAHPAAYYCKNLTTGGYNTWYLPAKDELNTMYSNKSAVPFATMDSFTTGWFHSSTEYNFYSPSCRRFDMNTQSDGLSKASTFAIRAIRRTAI